MTRKSHCFKTEKRNQNTADLNKQIKSAIRCCANPQEDLKEWESEGKPEVQTTYVKHGKSIVCRPCFHISLLIKNCQGKEGVVSRHGMTCQPRCLKSSLEPCRLTRQGEGQWARKETFYGTWKTSVVSFAVLFFAATNRNTITCKGKHNFDPSINALAVDNSNSLLHLHRKFW